MRKLVAYAAWFSAGLLAACGGGGGGGTPAASTAATVTVGGTASKGLMANADVAVYATNADGSIGDTALDTDVTDLNGEYDLSFEGTQGQPYVIVVSAKKAGDPDGETVHADEATNTSQQLPDGFTMRSLLVPSTSGTVTTRASVTPFSEMAVAAASRASGGVSAANARQAISTVTQLLGFNPTTVEAKTVAAAASAEEQTLALMLTSVSLLARNGDLGCSAGTVGEKAKCVVDKLGASASNDSIKLGDGVSAGLRAAVEAVLADDDLKGEISSTTLATVIANLNCEGECLAANAGATADAIVAAKQLFNEIKTDWSGMFSRGLSSISSGAVNQEAFQFQQVMTEVQVPVEILEKDVRLLSKGVGLYSAYVSGRTTETTRGSFDVFDPDRFRCTLYQDSSLTTMATEPGNANVVGCTASYRSSHDPSTGSFTAGLHEFKITPPEVGSESFGYEARAIRRVYQCVPNSNCSALEVVDQSDAAGAAMAAFAGIITPVFNASDGEVSSFDLQGELPAAFTEDDDTLLTLANFKHTIDMSVTETISGARADIAGSIVSLNIEGTTLGTLTVKSGSLIGAQQDGDFFPSSLALNAVWIVGSSEFEGDIEATDWMEDASQTDVVPTEMALSGTLRNIREGVPTDFLTGKLTATTTGYASFNETLPRSASNKYETDFVFVGAVTAQNRPTLEFTLGAGFVVDDRAPTRSLRDVTLRYRTLIAGVPKTVVDLTASRSSSGQPPTLFKLTEAASGLSMTWTEGAPSADLVHGNPAVKVGTLNDDTGVLTFIDGSFISLDIGL